MPPVPPVPPAPARSPAPKPGTVVARAPGRVNLIGEHTDHNGGLCLPIALTAGTTVTASRRDDDLVVVSSALPGAEPWTGRIDDVAPGTPPGGGADAPAVPEGAAWAGYAVGTLWALREQGVAVPGLDLHVEADLPVGAGLSSSASLEAAVALAAVALSPAPAREVTRDDVAAACRRAENEVVGVPTGGLDQAAVLHGRAGHALLLDFGTEPPRRRPVPFDPAGAGLDLLVVDTRVRHAHAGGEYAVRRAECAAAAATLGVPSLRHVAGTAALDRLDDVVLRRRARHVVTEDQRVRDVVAALADGDWTAVGAAMTASHRSLRDDFAVSCAELDLAVDTALGAGALGARMTGGGFGGCAIALVPRHRAEEVRTALGAAFAARGRPRPALLDGAPAAAAHLRS